ncbi:hypothetical protein MBLNU459_g7606t1 [Dothideomycetes sp. NU459]
MAGIFSQAPPLTNRSNTISSDPRFFATAWTLTNDKCPTILVPGKPPIWQPPTGASQLEEDSGEHFRDINAAHFPLHPTEPTVRALFVCNPTFPSQDIDVVACNSTLGNLLKFVRKLDNSFRFSVEFVGDTAFFVRRENSPTETIPDLRGYGHSFPEAYCEWEPDVRGSISHQRLIQYTFAGLDCVVRYKCDGYLKDKATKTSITAMDLNPTMDLLPSVTLPITRIAGAPIVQESLFDLKTRSAKRKENDTLGEELGHLWLTQTHNFVLAYHERGLFNDIRVTSIRDDVLEWESDNEETLDKLASLIREILAFVKGTVNGKCEIRRRDSEILEIREQTEDVTAALPLEVASLWRAGGPTNVSDNSDDHILSSHMISLAIALQILIN